MVANKKNTSAHFLYYTPEGKQTDFARLPGHYYGAVLKEANIYVRAFQLSERYKEWASQPENEKKLLSYFCEKFSSDEKLVKKLAAEDSKELYFYPLTKDRDARRERCIQAIAHKIDHNRGDLQQAAISPEIKKIISEQHSR